MANMHQFQADMLKIMCSQAAEVNNNEMQGIDENSGVDCKSPREIPRTALGENIETRRSQVGKDGIGEANHFDQVKEGEEEAAGMTPSRADVGDVYQTEPVESVLLEETKTEGNLIEKRQAVIFEVTDESLLNKKLDVADDLSTDDTVSVLELDSKAVKNFEEKEDEVSRLLFALRALCTSDNTDVVLLCGAWQMRAHSQVEKYLTQSRLLIIHCFQVLQARSRTLGELLGSTIDLSTKSISKLRLNMDPGALGIAVNYMYFNEVRLIPVLIFPLLCL